MYSVYQSLERLVDIFYPMFYLLADTVGVWRFVNVRQTAAHEIAVPGEIRLYKTENMIQRASVSVNYNYYVPNVVIFENVQNFG